MLSTISSVRPRVFISVPIAAESRQEKRPYRAASIAPRNLPTIATRDQQQRQVPEDRPVERVHLRLETGDHEVQRQQHEHDEVLEARADVGREAGPPRHDQPDQERAEDRGDPDRLRRERREQDGDEDDPEPERPAPAPTSSYAFETRPSSRRPTTKSTAVNPAASRITWIAWVAWPVPATAVASASRPHAVTSSIAGARERERSHRSLQHPPLDQDPRQHREGRDRHRDAHEQRERQIADIRRQAAGRSATRSGSRAPSGTPRSCSR